jgi:hypothetical protein
MVVAGMWVAGMCVAGMWVAGIFRAGQQTRRGDDAGVARVEDAVAVCSVPVCRGLGFACRGRGGGGCSMGGAAREAGARGDCSAAGVTEGVEPQAATSITRQTPPEAKLPTRFAPTVSTPPKLNGLRSLSIGRTSGKSPPGTTGATGATGATGVRTLHELRPVRLPDLRDLMEVLCLFQNQEVCILQSFSSEATSIGA